MQSGRIDPIFPSRDLVFQKGDILDIQVKARMGEKNPGNSLCETSAYGQARSADEVVNFLQEVGGRQRAF